MKGDASLTHACGPLVAALVSDDAATADWLVEFLAPSFPPTGRSPEWRVQPSTARGAYTELGKAQPLDAAPRACFALDQRVARLPAWSTREGVTLADAERSCFMSIGHFKIEVVGDPRTRRWRL